MNKTIVAIKYCRDIPKQLKMNKQIIRNLEDQYYLPGSNPMDGTPRAKGKISKLTEQLALNVPPGVSEVIRSLTEQNHRLNNLYKAIMAEIKTLEYREQKVIYEFYILEYKWDKIARGFYSVRQCKNIRSQALEKLDKKFKTNQEIKWYYLSL